MSKAIAYGLAVIALGTLGVGATGGVAAAAPSGTTTVTVRVTGCEGCVLRPMSAQQDADMDLKLWRGKPATVTGGMIRYQIPTRFTEGMSLEINAPWARGEVGAQLLVALSEGYPSEYDSSYIEGEHCWAGTQSRRATITVKVVRERGQSMSGGTAVYPLAWSTSLPRPQSAPGHQDLPYCSV